jgi:hypothetical protein
MIFLAYKIFAKIYSGKLGYFPENIFSQIWVKFAKIAKVDPIKVDSMVNIHTRTL